MAKRMFEGPAISKGSALKGNLQIDSVRGAIRVRKWPVKRGKNAAPKTKVYQEWFREALALVKRMEPGFLHQMMLLTKGGPLYPRDLALNMLSGHYCFFTMWDGRKLFPEAYQVDVSTALDVISQIPGTIMFRGKDLWEPVLPGLPGQTLFFNGADTPPVWADPSVGTVFERLGDGSPSMNAGGTIIAGIFSGRWFYPQSAISADRLCFPVRTANATCQVWPAIYSVTPAGTLGALIGTGPMVTGVTVGDNILPLSDAVIVAAGTPICMGVVCNVSSIASYSIINNSGCKFTCAGTPPATPPAQTLDTNACKPFYLIPTGA